MTSTTLGPASREHLSRVKLNLKRNHSKESSQRKYISQVSHS